MHIYTIVLPITNNLSSHWYLFILIQHHRVYSSVFPFHICNSLFKHWKNWLALTIIYCLITTTPLPITLHTSPFYPIYVPVSHAAFSTPGCPCNPQNMDSDSPGQLARHWMSSSSYLSSDFLLGFWPHTAGLPLFPLGLRQRTPGSPHTWIPSPSGWGSGLPVSGHLFVWMPSSAFLGLTAHTSAPSMALILLRLWLPFPRCRHTPHSVWALLPQTRLPVHGEPSYPAEAPVPYAGPFSSRLGSIMLHGAAPCMDVLFALLVLWHLTSGLSLNEGPPRPTCALT